MICLSFRFIESLLPPTYKLQIIRNLYVKCGNLDDMSVELDRFKQVLKNNGHFVTKPRLRLFGHLQNHKVVTVSQLISLLSHHDQATVYRNIKIFEGLGIISRLQLGWHSKLELSDTFQHHHHHMTCLKCGKVTVLNEDPAIEKQIEHMSARSNFKPIHHQLEIRGLCHICKKT